MPIYTIDYRDRDGWQSDSIEAASLDDALDELSGTGCRVRYVAGPDILCRDCGAAASVSYETWQCTDCRHRRGPLDEKEAA